MSGNKVIRLKVTVSYEGSTKQTTVDITPYVVKNAFFATKKKEIIYDTKIDKKKYTTESGDYLGKIARTLGVSVTELKKQNDLKSDDISIGQQFMVTFEEKIETGKKVTFTPLNKASIGEDIYIVVETRDLQGETMKIYVRQGKEKIIGERDKAIIITQNDKAMTEVNACVGELADHEGHVNKDYLRNLAVAQVTLTPKEDKEVKDWKTKINATADKKTYLYLHIEADVKKQVKYQGKNDDGSDDHEQCFRNVDGEWLELDICTCCVKMKKMTVDKDGFIQGMGYTKKHKTVLEHGELSSIEAIVLHRTDSDNVKNIIGNSSEGTHFWIEKDGMVYQAASLNKKTWHVGSGLYSKEKDETGKGDYENTWPHKKRGVAEFKKNYPDRYPINSDSVGIEVAGKWRKTEGKYNSGKYKGENKGEWDELTDKQKESIICLCRVLKKLYSLDNDDIYAHDDIKPKTKGEGSSYIDEILNELK